MHIGQNLTIGYLNSAGCIKEAAMGKSLKGKNLGDMISQRTDGRYMARFSDRFGKRKCLYSTDLAKLKKRLAKALAEDTMGLSVQDTSITLDSWYKVWLDTYKRPLLKNNSIVNYRNVYEKHISPALGKTYIS